MAYRAFISALTMAATLAMTIAAAPAWDDAKYPDWAGQWERIGSGVFDPSKRAGRGQQPPLTPEYQAIWEVNLAEEASGGQSYNLMAKCLPAGMPRMMVGYQPLELIVTPAVTYIEIAFPKELRRLYTDGRDFPQRIVPSYAGYSIGRWIDEDGDGRYDLLAIETRGLRGPRIFDNSGIPLHRDNQTVVKERIFLDKADKDVLRDELTVFDHALTRPWTVTRSYRRIRNPTWVEDTCAESNNYVFIGRGAISSAPAAT